MNELGVTNTFTQTILGFLIFSIFMIIPRLYCLAIYNPINSFGRRTNNLQASKYNEKELV